MALMKECVAQACWVVNLVMSLCFVVFSLSGQATKAADCKPAGSPICPNVEHCNFGFFWHLSMTAWVRLAISLFAVAGLGLAWVRSTLDTVKPTRGKERAYKRACDEFFDAEFAFEEAARVLKNANAGESDISIPNARDHYERCTAVKNRAAQKMELTKPTGGMALVEWVAGTRTLYCSCMLLFAVAALCANVSFFLSMEQHMGCVKRNSPWLIPFCAVAVAVIAWTYRFFVIGIVSV
jgi:hypothetical protein